MKSRLWKYLRRTVFVLIGLLAVFAVVFYWLVRRAWPEVDGRLAVPGLTDDRHHIGNRLQEVANDEPVVGEIGRASCRERV